MTRRLIGPSLMAAAMFVVLIGLGVWQIKRLHWKEGILAAIAAAERLPAEPLPSQPLPFHKYRITGHYAPALALYGDEVRDGPRGPLIGGELLQLFLADDGRAIVVQRGWVPEAALGAFAEASPPITLEGYVLPPERPGWFTPRDDPAHLRFYRRDPQALAAAWGQPGLAPFVFIALGPTPPGGAPDPAHSLPRPPNDHLSYALTWFGLAAALAVIYLIWLRGALRA